jgi:hypothetical protein
MNVRFYHAVWLLMAVFTFQAFPQNNGINIDAMRENAQMAQNKISPLYDIIDVKKTDAVFEIYYYINGSQDDEFEVSLVLVRESDPNFRIIPRHIMGKIGVGSFSGKNNSIVWNYKQDILKDLKGNDYRFDLTVRKIEQSSFPWAWVGIGAAAGGAAAVLLLGGKNSVDTPGQTAVAGIPAIGVARPN